MPEIEDLKDLRVEQYKGLSQQARAEAIQALDAENLDNAGAKMTEAKRFKRIADGVGEAFGSFVPAFLSFKEAFLRLNQQLGSQGVEPVPVQELVRYLQPPTSEVPVFYPTEPTRVEQAEVLPEGPIRELELVAEPAEVPAEKPTFPLLENFGVKVPRQAQAIYELVRTKSEKGEPATTPELTSYLESLKLGSSHSSVTRALGVIRSVLNSPDSSVRLKNLDEGTRKPAHYLLQHVQRDQEDQQPALAEETPQSVNQI